MIETASKEEIAKQVASEAVQMITADGSHYICLLDVTKFGLDKTFELDYTVRGWIEIYDAQEVGRDGPIKFIVTVNDPEPVMNGLKELFELVAKKAIEQWTK